MRKWRLICWFIYRRKKLFINSVRSCFFFSVLLWLCSVNWLALLFLVCVQEQCLVLLSEMTCFCSVASWTEMFLLFREYLFLFFSKLSHLSILLLGFSIADIFFIWKTLFSGDADRLVCRLPCWMALHTQHLESGKPPAEHGKHAYHGGAHVSELCLILLCDHGRSLLQEGRKRRGCRKCEMLPEKE